MRGAAFRPYDFGENQGEEFPLELGLRLSLLDIRGREAPQIGTFWTIITIHFTVKLVF